MTFKCVLDIVIFLKIKLKNFIFKKKKKKKKQTHARKRERFIGFVERKNVCNERRYVIFRKRNQGYSNQNEKLQPKCYC